MRVLQDVSCRVFTDLPGLFPVICLMFYQSSAWLITSRMPDLLPVICLMFYQSYAWLITSRMTASLSVVDLP